MKCPDCDTKITAKHFDTEYSWYECPKCEGCFTAEELIAEPVKATTGKVVAKGKKRQSEIQADEEAIAAFEAQQAKIVVIDKGATKHRDAVQTLEVVNIMADEIQAVYAEMGGSLDELNAQDKALTIWRELDIHVGVSAREKEVPHVLCGAHS